VASYRYPKWAVEGGRCVVVRRFSTNGGTVFEPGTVCEITGRYSGLHVRKIEPRNHGARMVNPSYFREAGEADGI
jgi:hypothetical protein